MKKLLYTLICLVSLSASAQVNRKILVEEFTGTWCGYCPDGHDILYNLEATYPNTIISNGMHITDALTIPYTTAVDANLGVAAYPRAAIDRVTYSGGNAFAMSRGYWAGAVAARLNVTSPVSINITKNFNSATRVLDITVEYSFVSAINYETRLTCILMENDISTSQSNYMNTTVGSPFYGLGNPIPNYLQKDVVRALLSTDNWGDSNHPATVTAGSTYTKTYSYTLPASWNENNVKVVAFINKKIGATPVVSTGTEILNAESIQIIGGTTSVSENNSNINDLKASPNPFSDITAVSFQLNKSSRIKAFITDLSGKIVHHLLDEQRNAGSHQIFWGGTDENYSKLNSGLYFFHIVGDDFNSSTKVMLMNN